MQLKLQQHHSKNRYKFQPSHRAWPITPEINVVFQGSSTINQFPLQNQLFSTNPESQIYTPTTIVGLHTQYQSQQTHVSQLLNHSNNAFYGFNNTYTGQLGNTAILQPNDSDYAQLPTSMFGFLNNTTTNRITNCTLNSGILSNNGVNNADNTESSELTASTLTNNSNNIINNNNNSSSSNNNNYYIISNSLGTKPFESTELSKICDSKSSLMNYQIKASTLTWEDLANVATTSTN